jgi:outer membrane protein TolC
MVGPNYHEPPKKIENHWLQSPLASTPLSQTAVKQAQWWYLFNDPTLTCLINLGYQNNLSLMGAGVRILQAIIDVAGAKTRFRPILMTSLAFILGVMPLVFASGAGANARRSIGISVASGMLASTCLAVVFVPSFYVLIQTWFEKKKAKKQNVLLIK